MKNTISSQEALLLADLHDLLVDSAKNGYSFSEADWARWKRENSFPREIMEPAYKALSEAWNAGSTSLTVGYGSPQKKGSTSGNNLRPNLDHPLDYLLFTVIRPHVDETLKILDQLLDSKEEDLSALCAFRAEMNDIKSENEAVTEHLRSLEALLVTLRDDYRKKMETGMPFEERMAHCSRELAKLDAPEFMSHWIAPVYKAPSYWQLVKASACASIFGKNRKVVFELFWKELCYLQAYWKPGARPIVPSIWAQMRTKKLVLSQDDDEETGMMDLDEDSDFEYDGRGDFMD
jgi:hypothetical protein